MLDEVHVKRLEERLGVTLPRFYCARIMKRNGATIRFKGTTWTFHPVFDDTDRKTARRTASHIGAETSFIREYTTFPREVVAIAKCEENARLLLMAREPGAKELAETIFYWDFDLDEPKAVAHDIVELNQPSRE